MWLITPLILSSSSATHTPTQRYSLPYAESPGRTEAHVGAAQHPYHQQVLRRAHFGQSERVAEGGEGVLRGGAMHSQ